MNTHSLVARGLLVASLGFSAAAVSAAPLYFDGFETDTTAWTNTTRVASGTGGVASADGGFHGAATSGAFTRFGGYNYGAGAAPTTFQPYRTSLDIYLNVGGGYANDTRFDYTSAINSASGTHLRDFAFNVGFYNDATGPGADTDRFVVSASNATGANNSFPKNPGRDPIAIAATGWYTFQHSFYDNEGVLAVDLAIFDMANLLIGDWTLSVPADLIAAVGGNRYGWLPTIAASLQPLAIDNALLETAAPSAVPEPATMLLLGVSLMGLAATRRRRA